MNQENMYDTSVQRMDVDSEQNMLGVENSQLDQDENFGHASSAELHKKFVKLGRERSRISHQLLVLLPYINKKSVFLEYGCGSIYEYAARFGDGLSACVVDKVLKLKANLVDCPALFETISTQGVHKVAIIASLANPENEKELVEVVENMSKEAVQEYSKEKRGKKIRVVTKIEMDEEMEFLFLKLKKKLKTASNKEAMKRLLQALNKQFFPEEKVEEEKVEQFFPEENDGDGKWKLLFPTKKVGRYIPRAKKREVYKKTAGRCSHDSCNRPIEALHHPDGYSKTRNHDNLVGLCKIHHEFAHGGVNGQLKMIDKMYRVHRQNSFLIA